MERNWIGRNFTGLLIAVIVFVTCWMIAALRNEAAQYEATTKWWSGKHELRRLLTKEEVEGSISGSFFLFGGSVAQGLELWFGWKTTDSDYAINHIPLDKVHIEFDEKVTTPTIEFKNIVFDFNENPQQSLDRGLTAATITCPSELWQSHLSMPLEDPVLTKN